VPEPPRKPVARLEVVERERARLKRELEEELQRLEPLNHYQRLGIGRMATTTEIQAAHEQRTKQLHPPPPNAPHAVRVAHERLVNVLQRARDTLSDEAERLEYDAALSDPEARGEPGGALAPAIAAQHAFLRGLGFEAQGDWVGALEQFMDAADRDPQEAAYLAHQAWASFSANPDDHESAARALTDLEQAAARNPALEDAHVFLGLIQERLGAREDAVKSLRRALEVNGDSVRALRALRTLEPAEEKKAGLLQLFRGS
jgi:curved DNA-binding protein CbpA